MAITLHNILRVLGRSTFGAASVLGGVEQTEMIIAAISLGIGIGIQNFLKDSQWHAPQKTRSIPT